MQPDPDIPTRCRTALDAYRQRVEAERQRIHELFEARNEDLSAIRAEWRKPPGLRWWDRRRNRK